ncbi:hypothetical protein [Acaricomes phytoseiuli]|uniref:hypothetical protein n=1 Tax=Acaricomes phytoseiuli TaxID=291968 RepID=UPI0005BC30E9|nr:hypothetical protein [Acaricomes phytoseiuli]
MADEPFETTGRFYTRARKFRQLIGTLPNGQNIPGGPYTITQVIIAASAGFVAWLSSQAGLWGAGNFTDWFMIGMITLAAGFLSGKVPYLRRNIVNYLNAVCSLLTATPGGMYRGKSLAKVASKARDKSTTPQKGITNQMSRQEPVIPVAMTGIERVMSGAKS